MRRRGNALHNISAILLQSGRHCNNNSVCKPVKISLFWVAVRYHSGKHIKKQQHPVDLGQISQDYVLCILRASMCDL